MQTFVPLPGFEASARALDNRRLGKQRVEVLQIVRALTYESYGWSRHPAVLMWRGCEEALGAYGVAICHEWRRRGFRDTCEEKIRNDLAAAGVVGIRSESDLAMAGGLPLWWGDERVHRSHRSSLLSKDPSHYAPLFDGTPHDLPYHWPVESVPSVRPAASGVAFQKH